MSDWAEATLKDGRVVRVEIEDLEGLEMGQAFTAHRDSHGTLWAARYSTIDKDRDQAIESDTRTLSDFASCPRGDAYGVAVWTRLMDEGEAKISYLFPTRREVLKGRGEWPTRDE